MKQIRIEDSVGCILSHDVTKIVPGEFKGRLFKKGHVIREEDIPKLLDIGKEHIYVWEPKKGQLHENDAAIRVKDLVLGQGCYISEEIKEGKIDFFANTQGIVKINKDLLLKLNLLGEIIVSTIHNNTPVKKGEKIGATRVIPLIIDEKKILEAEKIIKEKIISVEEIKPKKAVLITTGNEVYKGRIKDAFLPVMKEKLEYYGSEIVKQIILPDNKEMITAVSYTHLDVYKRQVVYTQRGELASNTFMQYKMPTRKDVGNIIVDFEESYEPTGPFGAKSVGEVVVNTPSPAIENAIYNGLGINLNTLPMTPEKVFMAMTNK